VSERAYAEEVHRQEAEVGKSGSLNMLAGVGGESARVGQEESATATLAGYPPTSFSLRSGRVNASVMRRRVYAIRDSAIAGYAGCHAVIRP